MTRADGDVVVRELKGLLGRRGWLRATSGNLSARLSDGTVLITASGTDKQREVEGDLVVVGLDGARHDDGPGRPSAETALHLVVYRHTTASVVIHVHTVFNNLVGQDEEAIHFQDHEMLKALGHWDEGASIAVPVLPNHADLSILADVAARRLDPRVPGFLVRRHGVYAWGASPQDAIRHLEALEFLFEWVFYRDLRRRKLTPSPAS